MIAALLAGLLSASPFPPPRLALVTEKTKCDQGTVLQVDAARGELRLTTPAGVVTLKVGPDVQVFDRAGQPAGGPARLTAGQKVRAYYVVDDGARAVEIAEE